MSVAQNFQAVTGSVAIDGRQYPFENAYLVGEDISFSVEDKSAALRYEFSGRIAAAGINGVARVNGANQQGELTWDAQRTETGMPAHALLKKPDLLELQQRLQ